MAILDFTMLFQILHECGQVRQAIGHHCVWPSEPEAPSNGSWILLVEDQITVATANEELLVILFSYFDGVVEPFIVDDVTDRPGPPTRTTCQLRPRQDATA